MFNKLISSETIDFLVQDIASRISADYKDKDVLIVSVLNGSFMFTADLVRYIKGPKLEIDFISISSYSDKQVSSGKINVYKDVSIDIKDKNIIICEDIIDSGRSIKFLGKYFLDKGAKSIKVCSLLLKEEMLIEDIEIHYLGCVIPNIFVVGYGMDDAYKYRCLDYIGTKRKCKGNIRIQRTYKTTQKGLSGGR